MRYAIPILLCIFIVSCRPDTFTPKPKGYYHVVLPRHTYQVFSDPAFPYGFEYPTYAVINRDTSFFGSKPENPYWINIEMPTIGSTIYISYKTISEKEPLGKLLEDAHNLSFYHTKKADFIDSYPFVSQYDVPGVLFSVGGDAASAYQFIATDSSKNFVRGALYFNVTPNADSLKPMNDFMRVDIEHILQTFKWNR